MATSEFCVLIFVISIGLFDYTFLETDDATLEFAMKNANLNFHSAPRWDRSESRRPGCHSPVYLHLHVLCVLWKFATAIGPLRFGSHAHWLQFWFTITVNNWLVNSMVWCHVSNTSTASPSLMILWLAGLRTKNISHLSLRPFYYLFVICWHCDCFYVNAQLRFNWCIFMRCSKQFLLSLWIKSLCDLHSLFSTGGCNSIDCCCSIRLPLIQYGQPIVSFCTSAASGRRASEWFAISNSCEHGTFWISSLEPICQCQCLPLHARQPPPW